MRAALVGVLVLAVVLALSPPRTSTRRARAVLGGVPVRHSRGFRAGRNFLRGQRRSARTVPMTVVVQQMAALLKGGRAPSRLWDELWILYPPGPAADQRAGPGQDRGATLSPYCLSMLAAARAAAMRGSPVGKAIRTADAVLGGRAGRTRAGEGQGTNRRIWVELAACLDVAGASGCPLSDVLARFAAQLDAADDADAARRTALAGPQATVRLLTWLPVLGFGLGVLLGADPAAVLLGTPFGLAALAAGTALTAAGRIWSAALVRSAAGPP